MRVLGRQAVTDYEGADEVGLPLRFFLYTLDQIATMTNISIDNLSRTYLYYDGRTIGPAYPNLLKCRNVAARDAEPEWRVADRELIRWLKNRGFKVIERSYVRS